MPEWKVEIAKRLTGLKLSPAREAEIIEELTAHFEDRYRELIDSGLSADAAYRATLKEFSGDELFGRQLRALERAPHAEPVVLGMKTSHFLSDLWRDLRYGIRMLGKNRTFTIVAVLTLAVGIGGNAAIFSILNAVLLRPLPYPHPERLVMVWESRPREGVTNNVVAPADFVDWHARQRVFEAIAAKMDVPAGLTGDGEPERLPAGNVSAAYFKVFGIVPTLGRDFLPEEDRGPNRVVILSRDLWQRRFGGDPAVLGRRITLNGEPYEVIGVMAPSNDTSQLWYPIDFTTPAMQARTIHYLLVYARLKAGRTLEQAQKDMDRIAAELHNEVPERNREHGAHVTSLREEVVGDVRPSLAVLAVAVGFVLLIACVNVANLLLARGVMRQRELAIRHALGASRLRIVRQFSMECLCLTFLSAAAGLPIAIWGADLLKSIAPVSIPLLKDAGVDVAVLGYMIALALLTAFLCGLGPALQVTSVNPGDVLKANNPTASPRRRLRHCLIVSEIALAFVLLTAAGLMMRTLWNLIHVQPGFEAENVLTMPISLSRLQLENRPAPVFFAELIERIHVLPGVTGVGLTSHLPLEINDSRTGMAIEGRDPDPAEPTRAHWRIVSPEYFDTMRIRLVEGRLPAVSDLARGDAFSPVVLVNRTAARRYWPGQSPVGKRVQMFGGWREIVGIVDDVKHWGLGQSVNPEAYLPGLGTPVILGLRSPTILVIRTARDPVELAAAIRQEVRQIDANLPISTIRPMADVVSQSVASPRFYLILLVLFGTVAVILAAAGIYGVVSYTVAQSTREIGMRIALGARPRDVTRTIVGHGLILTLVSVAIGIVASIGLTRMMRALLFGVESTDPMTFAATAAFTGAVALLACYVPARRAAKVDPIVALRHQ